MAGINTILRMQDQMSAVLRNTIGVMNTMVETAARVGTSTEQMMDPSSVASMRSTLQEAGAELALMEEAAKRADAAVGAGMPAASAGAAQLAVQTEDAVATMVRMTEETEKAVSSVEELSNVSVVPPGIETATEELTKMGLQAEEATTRVSEMEHRVGRLHRLAVAGLGLRVFAETTGAERALRRITDGSRWQTKIVPFVDSALGERRLSALMEKFRRIRGLIGRNKDAQDRFNGSIQDGTKLASRLGGLIGRLGLAYAALRGVKGFVGSADEYASIHARLNLIRREGETIQGIQQATFDAATRARGDYVQLSDIVSKMGLQAKAAFRDTAEVVAFSEQLQKNFAIAGTDSAGQSSVLYNLTQAMALGKLQGQDLRAVLSNIPQVGEMIAKYMDVPIGKVKELAKEGELSSLVVKNAVLASAAETDAAFAKMPKTFGQIAADLKNRFFRELEGAQEKWLQFLNSERFDRFANRVSRGFRMVAEGALWAVDRVAEFSAWITRADGSLKPWVKTILTMIPLMYLWSRGIGTVKMMWDLLSRAMFSSPWGALLTVTVGVLTYKFYRWAESVGGVGVAMEILRARADFTAQSAQLSISTIPGAVERAGRFVVLMVRTAGNAVLGAVSVVIEDILSLIDSMIASVARGLNWLIEKLNSVAGTSYQALNEMSIAGELSLSMKARREADTQKLKVDWAQLDLDSARASSQYAAERLRLTEELNQRIQTAKDNAKPKGMDEALKTQGLLRDIEKYTAAMSGNTKDIKGKLSDGIDVENEDLKYLKNLLTARAIQRFSFDKIVVQVDNRFGDVHETADLDGWTSSLTDGLREAVQTTVSGLSEAVEF